MASKAQKRLNKLMNTKNRIAREGERDLRQHGVPVRRSSIFSVHRSSMDAARREIETGVRQEPPARPNELDTLRRLLGM